MWTRREALALQFDEIPARSSKLRRAARQGALFTMSSQLFRVERAEHLFRWRVLQHRFLN
jgi:hypothetical protein